nr:hypothetical protein [Bacteroidota bacterium]
MNAQQQIKADLINAINQINNPFLLLEMSKLIKLSDEDNGNIKLTNHQIDELKIAIQQIENGEFLTHEEAKRQSEAWLED